MTSKVPSLSVLICTYNRHELLHQALKALIENTTEKPDEVIIVNGGNEYTDSVVDNFVQQHYTTVQLVKTVNINLATSRNIGLSHCRGDIVAMTDDDATVFPDWVTQMKRAHLQHPEAGVIGGAIIGANSQTSLLSRLSDLVTFPLPNKSSYVRTVPGVNVSYKRSVLDQVGNQDTTLFRGEDVDFNWRIKKLGYEVYFCPDIKVIHYHRPDLKNFFRQHYMYGRAYYRVRSKWPDMYCVYPHALKAPRDYAKLIHFFIAIIYQPILTAANLKIWYERILAVPILIINHALWKYGMLYQMFLDRYRLRQI